MKTRKVSNQYGAVKPQRSLSRSKQKNTLIVSKTNNYVFARSLINAVHESIIILDSTLTIQAANSSFFKTFKLTRDDIMQHNLSEFTKRNPKVKTLIRRLEKLNATHSEFKEFELKYNFSADGERVLLFNAKHIIFDHQQSDFILVSVEDITRRKLIEQQKDDFVGYVTHELKTPLTSLSAFIQILQGYHEKTHDKKSQFLIAKVAGQVERLTTLLSSFNTVYKAQHGVLQPNKSLVNLTALVTEAVETFQYTTATHTITIEGGITKEIIADRERIRQVIVNLLINAIKYSPNADAIIVKLAETEKVVTVSVEDFGLGIPKSQQEQVFERFFRVKAKEKYNIKGLGLGLYITREIISAHKGKLWVDSLEGHGSTFSFSLPAK